MIFRLSEKLSRKIKAGTLPSLPVHDCPLVDWSSHLFLVNRTQYILLCNTMSLYSTVMHGKGITSYHGFIERALTSIREFLEAEGQGPVYHRFIEPAGAAVQFAKALSRSVTGSMTDLAKHAAYWLATEDISPVAIGMRLKLTPMSALKHNGRPYGMPRDVFAALVGSAEGERPGPDG
jgi:hypothetical protein